MHQMIPLILHGLSAAFLVSNFSVTPHVTHEWRSRRSSCPETINVSFVANNSFFQYTLGKTAEHPPEYVTTDLSATFLFCDGVSGMLVKNDRMFDFITAATGAMTLEPIVATYLKTVETTCSSVPTTVDIGIVVGYEAWTLWDSNEDTVAENIAKTLMKAKLVFKREFQLELKHTQTIISKESKSHAFNGCDRTMGETLELMPGSGLPPSGVWLLLNDCKPDCSDCTYTAGIAWIESVCNQDYNFGVINLDAEQTTWTTVAHELGHLFGGKHPFDAVLTTLDMDGDSKINQTEWNAWEAKINWAPSAIIPTFSVIDTDGDNYINETEIQHPATGLQGKFQTIMDYRLNSDIVEDYTFGNVNKDIMCSTLSKQRVDSSCAYVEPAPMCNPPCSQDSYCVDKTCTTTTISTTTSTTISTTTPLVTIVKTTPNQPTTAPPAVLGKRWFDDRDINGDAKVTFDEAGLPPTRFNALDANNDGVLTIAELLVPTPKKTSIPRWKIILSASVGGVMFIVVIIQCNRKPQRLGSSKRKYNPVTSSVHF